MGVAMCGGLQCLSPMLVTKPYLDEVHRDGRALLGGLSTSMITLSQKLAVDTSSSWLIAVKDCLPTDTSYLP